jgi:hypothetical protein
MKKDFIAQGLAFLLARWAPSIARGATCLGYLIGLLPLLICAVLFEVVNSVAGFFSQGAADIIVMVFGLVAVPYFCLGCRAALAVRAYGVAMRDQGSLSAWRLRRIMAGFDATMREIVVAHFGRGMDDLIKKAEERVAAPAFSPVPDGPGFSHDFAVNLISLLIVRHCRSVYDGCQAAGILLTTILYCCCGVLIKVVALHLGLSVSCIFLVGANIAGGAELFFLSRSLYLVLLIHAFGIALLNQEDIPLPRFAKIMAELNHERLRNDIIAKFDDDMRLLMTRAKERIKGLPNPLAKP